MEPVEQRSSAARGPGAKTYQGSCFCGAVQFSLTGEPAAMGYCHCESCRHWSAGPVNAFTLWKPDALRITRGAENVGTYNKTPRSSANGARAAAGISSPSIRTGDWSTCTRR